MHKLIKTYQLLRERELNARKINNLRLFTAIAATLATLLGGILMRTNAELHTLRWAIKVQNAEIQQYDAAHGIPSTPAAIALAELAREVKEHRIKVDQP